jgi:hypothetical protein
MVNALADGTVASQPGRSLPRELGGVPVRDQRRNRCPLPMDCARRPRTTGRPSASAMGHSSPAALIGEVAAGRARRGAAARGLADHRRPHPAPPRPTARCRSAPTWELPARPGRLTPARVRRGFRNIRPTTLQPARAPKPSHPGPGRPLGSRNRHPAPSHDVGKPSNATRPSSPDNNAQAKIKLRTTVTRYDLFFVNDGLKLPPQ